MNKGKRIPVLLALAAAMAAAGCRAAPAAEAEPEPIPTPAPAIGIGVVSGDEAFLKAVEEGLPEGYEVTEGAADVTMLYMPEPHEVARYQGARVIFTDKPHIVVEGVSGAVLSAGDAVQAAWDALYGYPTHSTPIRLLTLVNSRGGDAYGIYEEMLQSGKLQGKGLYVAEGAELTPEEWTAQALDGIPVGLLDTIYAEDAELAMAACEALRADERNDSVEVICAELSQELVELMMEDHWTMGAAVGASPEDAADAMLELAEAMAQGGGGATVSIAPKVVYSDDVKALMDRGMDDAGEIMAELLS